MHVDLDVGGSTRTSDRIVVGGEYVIVATSETRHLLHRGIQDPVRRKGRVLPLRHRGDGPPDTFLCIRWEDRRIGSAPMTRMLPPTIHSSTRSANQSANHPARQTANRTRQTRPPPPPPPTHQPPPPPRPPPRRPPPPPPRTPTRTPLSYAPPGRPSPLVTGTLASPSRPLYGTLPSSMASSAWARTRSCSPRR